MAACRFCSWSARVHRMCVCAVCAHAPLIIAPSKSRGIPTYLYRENGKWEKKKYVGNKWIGQITGRRMDISKESPFIEIMYFGSGFFLFFNLPFLSLFFDWFLFFIADKDEGHCCEDYIYRVKHFALWKQVKEQRVPFVENTDFSTIAFARRPFHLTTCVASICMLDAESGGRREGNSLTS